MPVSEWNSKQLLRRTVIALSFANLCFFKVWWDLLAFQKKEQFFLSAPPEAAHFWAVILNIFVLGCIAFLALSAAVSSRSHAIHRIFRISFLFALLIPANSVLGAWAKKVAPLHLTWWLHAPFGYLRVALLGITLLAVVWTAIRYRMPVVPFGERALVLLFPLFPILLVQGAWTAIHTPSDSRYAPLALHSSHKQKKPEHKLGRVAWIIFDEWDYGMSFLDEAMQQKMPSIQHFSEESLFARNAFPPGAHTTVSVPSLLSGQFIHESKPKGPSELDLFYENSKQSLVWGKDDNLISKLYDYNARIAIAGFLFPYTRVFSSLADCTECSIQPGYASNGTGFTQIAKNQLRSLLETNFKSPWKQSLTTLQFRHCYESVTAAAIRAAADPQYDFVFLHLPVPHGPFFYNSKTDRFDLSGSPASGYMDALTLLDHTAQNLRTAMEQAKLWEQTTVVYSSDHWNRNSEWLGVKTNHHVPFLMKLAGQKSHLEYVHPFNTVLTRGLLESVMNKEINAPEEAAEWLDEHRGNVGEITYYSLQ